MSPRISPPLHRAASDADLLDRERLLDRDWMRKRPKSPLPKYDSLPRLRLRPTERPVFTCPSPQCGFSHFVCDLPICIRCKSSDEHSVQAYRLSVLLLLGRRRAYSQASRPRPEWEVVAPRSGPDSSSFVGDSRSNANPTRRMTISGLAPLPAELQRPPGTDIGRPQTHHRSHSTPIVPEQRSPLVGRNSKRQPIYSMIRRPGWPPGQRSPTSLSFASNGVASPSDYEYETSRTESEVHVLEPGTPQPISNDAAGSSSFAWLLSSKVPSDALIYHHEEQPYDTILGDSDSSDSHVSSNFKFAFALPPPPLPPLDPDDSYVAYTPRTRHTHAHRRRGSLPAWIGSPLATLSALHREAEMRAALAATVRPPSPPSTSAGQKSRLPIARAFKGFKLGRRRGGSLGDDAVLTAADR
ncbi:hypothetical protein MKEN_00318200 [Mycena kentingensis (nom. inval.)]|nr:hypothetical protein MKEN_00318200 [Mycena kentingensis (nom. inval.)]